VRRIMGPRQSVSYSPVASTFSSSHINETPRRPKRKGKYQLAVGKYGNKKKKPIPPLPHFKNNCTCSNIWDQKHQTVSLGGRTKT